MITATVLFPHDTFGVTILRGVAYKWADAWNEHLDGWACVVIARRLRDARPDSVPRRIA